MGNLGCEIGYTLYRQGRKGYEYCFASTVFDSQYSVAFPRGAVG